MHPFLRVGLLVLLVDDVSQTNFRRHVLNLARKSLIQVLFDVVGAWLEMLSLSEKIVSGLIILLLASRLENCFEVGN